LAWEAKGLHASGFLSFLVGAVHSTSSYDANGYLVVGIAVYSTQVMRSNISDYTSEYPSLLTTSRDASSEALSTKISMTRFRFSCI